MKKYKLGEVCLLSKGKTITRATSTNGEVPVIGGGLGPTYFHNVANCKPPVITISASGANAGYVNYWELPIWASDCSTISEKSDSPASIGYIYKYLQSRQEFINTELRRGSAQPHVYPSDIAELEISLPSREKQREIVEALDSAFAEIEELRNNTIIEGQLSKLLTSQTIWNLLNDSKLERKETTLEKICDNLDNQRIPITRDVRASGKYPYYGASGIIDYVENFIFEGDALLVSEDGANLLARSTPSAFSVTGKYWVNNHAHILKFSDPYLQKYVECFLENTKLDMYITGAAQPKLTQRALNTIPIKIPVNKSDIETTIETIATFAELGTLLTNNLKEKLRLADDLKSSLLSSYFGQLVA